MIKLLLRKLIQGVIMVLIVSAVTFGLLSTAGGDTLISLRENPQVSERTIENLRRVYGLDRPLAVRYGIWLSSTLRGELGESFYFRTPVLPLVLSRFAGTFSISLAAIIWALAVALVLGLLSARYRWKWLSNMISLVVILTSSTPRLVIALVAIALIARSDELSTFIMAAIVLAVPLIAIFLAQFSQALNQAMAEDYVQLARAKGLSEWVVIFRHAMRAALNPVLTMLGLSFGGLLGGSVIVEAIIGRSGLGSLMVTAVRNRDVPLIMGIVLLASAAVWVGNAIAEFLQMINDKRISSLETR